MQLVYWNYNIKVTFEDEDTEIKLDNMLADI